MISETATVAAAVNYYVSSLVNFSLLSWLGFAQLRQMLEQGDCAMVVS